METRKTVRLSENFPEHKLIYFGIILGFWKSFKDRSPSRILFLAKSVLREREKRDRNAGQRSINPNTLCIVVFHLVNSWIGA